MGEVKPLQQLFGSLSFCMDKTDVPVVKAILITIQKFEVGKWCLLTVCHLTTS